MRVITDRTGSNRDRSARRWDLLGMTNSLLCLVHCLAMPFLVAIGAAFLHHPVVAVLFVALAAWAVRTATRNARGQALTWFLWSAWSVFALAFLLEDLHHGVEVAGLVASGALVLGHGLHWWRLAALPPTQASLSSMPSTIP